MIRKQFVSIVGAAEHPVYGQIEWERKIKRSTHAHVSTCSVSPVEPRLQVPPRGHSCWNSSPMIFSRPSCKFYGRGRSAVYQLHSKSIQRFHLSSSTFSFVHLFRCFLPKISSYTFCWNVFPFSSLHEFKSSVYYLLFHFLSTHICSVSFFSRPSFVFITILFVLFSL